MDRIHDAIESLSEPVNQLDISLGDSLSSRRKSTQITRANRFEFGWLAFEYK